MSRRLSHGDLKPAHSGYRLQDIASAYLLVRSLSERYEQVVVDRKEVLGDQIDDIEVAAQGMRTRRQFKSSRDPERRIAFRDFIASDSSLRIDRLILSHTRLGTSTANEYRLCATWQPPAPEDSLADFLEPIVCKPTVEHSPSMHFRLRSDVIWAPNSTPLWAPLEAYARSGAEFGRDDFVEFCERFVIELGLPSTSTTLTRPGPIEEALINELAERVGIGRYPNQGRSAQDVAALAVSLANLARTQSAALTPEDIEVELSLRTDFGRVAQAFPVDESKFCDRPAVSATLRQAALSDSHQLVTGPPGSGKSWALTRQVHSLREEPGVIVARHYCYLEPGDPLVERRVTTDVFFANLIADLIDAEPALLGSVERRYSAGPSELEEVLRKAAVLKRVVLIIDGLDHITRVRGDSQSLALSDTDIIERLATLDLPDNVTLVIGSQPGDHLEPLRIRWGDKIHECAMADWTATEIRSLAKLHGVMGALESSGLIGDEADRVVDALAARAEGNPLYARSLSRGLIVGLQKGYITNPYDWLSDAPAIGNDIATYYGHLYRNISENAKAIADIFGVIDFAVTESELTEILGDPLADWLPQAMDTLSPVLTYSAGQGGVRVFHESFRRFIQAELVHQGRSMSNVLSPIVKWLEARGFYKDAKSFRFLLHNLRRSGRSKDILSRVGIEYVSESIANAHPLEAIVANLALAADVAARVQDWPALVRFIELHRSAQTAFDESQNSWDGYWQAYLELFGAEQLAQRLLFDGHPTQPVDQGLLACELIDDADGVAPWQEYLNAFTSLPAHTTLFESSYSLNDSERVNLALTLGRLRVASRRRVIARVLEYLKRAGDKFKPAFLIGLASRLMRVLGPGVVEKIAGRSSTHPHKITPRAAAAIRLGMADEYARQGALVEATTAASAALLTADTPELAALCLTHGASPESCAVHAADVRSLPIAVGPDTFVHSEASFRTWVASVQLLANDQLHNLVLEHELERVSGKGWYRCWLRYVVMLAIVEAGRRSHTDDETSVLVAFEELERDVRPFSGEPRACDLYTIRNLIAETVGRGLALLRTKEEWERALDILANVSHSTASQLDREDGGPLPIGTILDLLLRYTADAIAGKVVKAFFDREAMRRDENGTYYPTHAEYAIRLARARHAGGDTAAAETAWKRAGVFLAGYGWRKDTTIYELLQSVGTLGEVSRNEALEALTKLQTLADAVVAHTDGRSTNHAPNAWLRSLLKIDAALGTTLAASTTVQLESSVGWQIETAVRDVCAELIDSADPALLDSLLRTLRFEVDADNVGAEAADARLAPVIKMASSERSLASEALRQVAAEVAGHEGQRYSPAVRRLQEVAAELELLIPQFAPEFKPPDTIADVPASPGVEPLALRSVRTPAFEFRASFVDLLRGLRAAGRERTAYTQDIAVWDDVLTPLSYHVTSFIDDGKIEDVKRLLSFFARDVYVSSFGKPHPLVNLAGYLENAGYHDIAAFTYALGFAATRGGWGERLGSPEDANALGRGLQLNRAIALQTISDEIAYALRDDSFTFGYTRNLVPRISDWGAPAIAAEAWHQAFDVIAHRLALPPKTGRFSPLDCANLPSFSGNEATIALLFARLGDPCLRPKIAALRGLVLAIQRTPDDVAQPLMWWLSTEPYTSSILLVLDALLKAELPPFVVTATCRDALMTHLANSERWSICRLARKLLSRIGEQSFPESHAVAVNRDAQSDLSLSLPQRDRLLSGDVGGKLVALSSIEAQLPDRVAVRISGEITSSEVHKNRAYSRYRLMFGRDGESRPATPVLAWESELFLEALSRELTSVIPLSPMEGEDLPLVGGEPVLDYIVPNTPLHVGLSASMTVRPDWDFPKDASESVSGLPIVTSDPMFSGWSRIAYSEEQYVCDPDKPYEPPSELVIAAAGAIAVGSADEIPASAFPLLDDASPNDWFLRPITHGESLRVLRKGPLVSISFYADWLGKGVVLVPPRWLADEMSLKPPDYGAPLAWMDAAGEPAIVLRSWRVLNTRARDCEPALLEGCDLIARPDILTKLQQTFGIPIRELRVVRHGLVP